MGLIITRDQYTVQPQGLPRIDKANRLGGRVRSLVLRGVNLANGKTATWSGTKKFSGRAPDGLLTSLDGSSYLDLTNIGLYNPASTGVTLAFVARNGTPASVGGTLRITPSSGGNTFCAIRGTSTSYRLGAGYAAGGTLPMFAGAAVATSGVAERTVITCANGLTSTTSTDYKVWINGTKYTTSGPIAFAAQTAGATYFGWDGADSKFPGTLDELAVFEGALSDAEVAEYFRNPYQMYARPAARVWFGAAAAGGGSSLTPGVAALTLSGPAPTLAQTTSSSLTPGAGALTLAGPAPTVAQTTSSSLTPGALALTLAGPAPTVSQTSGLTVIPAAAALTLAGPAPTVAQSAHVSLTPAAAALTLAGPEPTVVRAGNVSVTPGAAALTLATAAPTVAQTTGNTLTPAAATLSLAGAAPTVDRTTNVALSPAPATLAITTYLASLSAGIIGPGVPVLVPMDDLVLAVAADELTFAVAAAA